MQRFNSVMHALRAAASRVQRLSFWVSMHGWPPKAAFIPESLISFAASLRTWGSSMRFTSTAVKK